MAAAESSSRRAAIIYNPTKVDLVKLKRAVAKEQKQAGWRDSIWLPTTVEDVGGAQAREAIERRADVVLAAGGYPEAPRTGDPISGLDAAAQVPGVNVFHAGTKLVDGREVTAGGRVLGVTARGATIAEAQALAYRAAELITFEGCQYRRDIAARALGKGQ